MPWSPINNKPSLLQVELSWDCIICRASRAAAVGYVRRGVLQLTRIRPLDAMLNEAVRCRRRAGLMIPEQAIGLAYLDLGSKLS